MRPSHSWKEASLSPKLKVLISKDDIEREVARLAQEVRRDYEDKNPLLVAILKGSFVFLADLIRLLGFPLEIEFVRLSSYGAETQSSGRIKMAQRLTTPVRGRHVLVVEDIVDTGLTLNFLRDYLRRKQPSSLKLCALVDKPSRRRVPVTIDYLGFTIEDYFVVGYGLDWDERFRYLPEICVVEETS